VHDGYDRLGMVYEARGENRQAADCYRKVIAFIREHPDDYEPGNHLTRSERQTQCNAALQSLAERIVDYRPLAIVSLMHGIKNIVESAAVEAESGAQRFAVPFPGQGHQKVFHNQMVDLMKNKLPRILS
jgi:hypothetical protein